MAGISAKQIENMIRYVNAAEANGWNQGTTLRRPEIAHAAGLGVYELDTVVRLFKENPDLGVSISTRRGAHPFTIVTTKGERVVDDVLGQIHEISDSKMTENLKRTVRDVSSSLVAWRKANHSLKEGRHMKPYVSSMQKYLYDVRSHAVEDGDPFGIREMAERALALLGVRFDDDDLNGS